MAEQDNSSIEEKQLEFEKYKVKIELFKWIISSVALVIITMLIDFGFRDRAAGLQEIEQYDKYVTELIVLNKEPGQKRMLAQFFSTVTPSEKLKKGWGAYYKEVNKEYQKYIVPIVKSNEIVKEKYDELAKNLDSNNTKQVQELKLLGQQIENFDRKINPEIILPNKSQTKDYNKAIEWESKGFSFLFARDVKNAILAFRSSENSYNQFHQVYEIANYLSVNESKLIDQNSTFWNTAFKQIATDFPWKMPEDVRKRLQKGI